MLNAATTVPTEVSFPTHKLLEWYDVNARALPWRVSPADRARGVAPDPYRVWLSEIMLQQTTVPAVGKYYARFLQLWPHVQALAAASLDEVRTAWAGLGYYSRARNLHMAAQEVAFNRGGIFPKTAHQLIELPGVGPYTAAAIAAICYDEPVAVLDGNVERVMARYLRLDQPVRNLKPQLRAAVQAVTPPRRAGDFAQAMMDLGATICAPRRTDCPACPLVAHCIAAKSENPTRWPPAAPRTVRPQKFGHAFVMLRADGAVFLRKRAEKGILAGMTAVPESAWAERPTEPDFPMPGAWSNAGAVTHIFTHLRLELTVWTLRLPKGSDFAMEGDWHPWAELGGRAVPSLYKKVLTSAAHSAGWDQRP